MITDPIESAGKAVEKLGDAVDKNITSKEEILAKNNENTANARDMQKAAYDQEDVFSKRAIHYLAFAWTAIGAIYMFAVSFLPIPEANLHNVNTITGFMLGTIVAGIITFYFGSSYGSSQKTRQTDGLLNRMFTRKDKKQ